MGGGNQPWFQPLASLQSNHVLHFLPLRTMAFDAKEGGLCGKTPVEGGFSPHVYHLMYSSRSAVALVSGFNGKFVQFIRPDTAAVLEDRLCNLIWICHCLYRISSLLMAL